MLVANLAPVRSEYGRVENRKEKYLGGDTVRTFYRTPTRVALLAIMAGWLIVSLSAGSAVAEEREPLMDLQRGGIDFFKEVVPSIAQVFTGGAGSGYIIDREGHLITNYHVTRGNTMFEICFYGDHEETSQHQEGRWRAELVAEDPQLDLAVIRVDAPPDRFHPVRLGDSAIMRPGDACVTFGSPGGDPNFPERSYIGIQDDWLEFFNINLGVIAEIFNFEESFSFYWFDERRSARTGSRDYGAAVQYLFHTDSAINRGNSGGPCLNAYGEAIGTNTWGTGGENMGFSVPVNLLKRSVTDIIEYGRVRRPWFGIALHPPNPGLTSVTAEMSIGIMDEPFGVFADIEPDVMEIYTVNPYAPAYEAGIREGDVLLKIDGREFVNIFDVYSYILDNEVGRDVLIEYERRGHGMPPVVVTLAEKQVRFDSIDINITNPQYLQFAYRVNPWQAVLGYSRTHYTAELTY